MSHVTLVSKDCYKIILTKVVKEILVLFSKIRKVEIGMLN